MLRNELFERNHTTTPFYQRIIIMTCSFHDRSTEFFKQTDEITIATQKEAHFMVKGAQVNLIFPPHVRCPTLAPNRHSAPVRSALEAAPEEFLTEHWVDSFPLWKAPSGDLKKP